MSGFAFGEILDPADTRAARLAQARIALRMRFAARIVVIPALAAMLWGLILISVAGRPAGPLLAAQVLATTPTVALAALFGSRQAFTPYWWMSLGLLGLIALPGISVALVLWENIRLRRWADVALAAGILGILLAGALATRR